jgi:hypothetical protein
MLIAATEKLMMPLKLAPFVRPTEATTEARNVLLDPEWMQLLHTVMEVLTAFPEARAQVVEALMKLGSKPAA